MRWRAPMIAAASAVLLSCALLSGAADLTVGEPPPAEVDGESNAPDATTPNDARAATDAPVDANGGPDARPPVTNCDEPGLVARWTLDELSGSAVFDCTHFHHDGHNDGGTRVLGERDGGMSFDGGWIGFGNPADLELTGPLTVCAWIRPTAFPVAAAARGYIVGKLSNPYGGGWRFATGPGTAPSGTISMNIPDGDGGLGETNGGSLVLDVWSHVCMVYQLSGQAVYIAEKQVARDATPHPTITPTSDELRIGARADSSEFYIGAVDDVRIYSRVLTDLEIKTLAQP